MILIKNVSKTYKLPYDRRSTLFSRINSIGKPNKCKIVKPLRNISLEIKKGEIVGLIGKNGSGKTTLLRIIAGIINPDEGTITTKGNIVPYFELGAGFVTELSAKENIILGSTLYGQNKELIKKNVPKILEIADLKEFADVKVKHFSSGMFARLAFVTAMHYDGDIFLLDELLTVGDVSFKEYCMEVFSSYKKNNKTVIIATHNLELLQKVCDRIIWIEEGKIMADSKPKEAVHAYVSFIFSRKV